MNESGVYFIKSKKLDISYVGSSINMKRRMTDHRYALMKGSHENNKLQKHYDQYGSKDLVYGILEECSKERMKYIEQYYMDNSGELFNRHPALPKVSKVTPGVFKISCNLTGRYYIGATKNMLKGLIYVRHMLKKNKYHNKNLQQIYNQHGPKNLTYSVIVECSVDNLDKFKNKNIATHVNSKCINHVRR